MSIESNTIEARSSPYIDNEKWTNIQVDSQVLSTFMACARKADYVFNQHLVPLIGVSDKIQKGQLSHIGLHRYWRCIIDGKGYQEATLEAIDETKKEALKFTTLNAEDALQVYQNLVEYFRFI